MRPHGREETLCSQSPDIDTGWTAFLPRLKVVPIGKALSDQNLDTKNGVLCRRPNFGSGLESCCSQQDSLELSRYTKGQCPTSTSLPKVSIYVSRIEVFSSTVTVSVIVFPSVWPV